MIAFETPDGSLVLLLAVRDNTGDNITRINIMKISESGVKEWGLQLESGIDNEYARGMTLTDGGVIIIGSTTSIPQTT